MPDPTHPEGPLARPEAPLEGLARSAGHAIQQAGTAAMTDARRDIDGALRFFLGSFPVVLVSFLGLWLIGTNPITALFLSLLLGGFGGVLFARVPRFRGLIGIYRSKWHRTHEQALQRRDAQYEALDVARSRILRSRAELAPEQQKRFDELEMNALNTYLAAIGGARSPEAIAEATPSRSRKTRGS